MDFLNFKKVILSGIKENDQYLESKERQLRNWCFSYFTLFRNTHPSHQIFASHVLSDEDCWEKSDSIHGVILKRKLVAKIFVQLQKWKTETNPLHVSQRLRVACWCCLEEDIVNLFTHIKRLQRICDNELVKDLSERSWSDDLIKYWLYVAAGFLSEIPMKDMHLYEYGLYISLTKTCTDDMGLYRGHVEGVEFFWNKIKSLSEGKFSAHRKHENLMRAAVRAAGLECSNNPEIFEFFITQISPNICEEFMKREFSENKGYHGFSLLWNLRRFDQMYKLFDCFPPDKVDENFYRNFLNTLNVKQFSKNYANEAAKLFMHVWTKVGFDRHRLLVLRNEMCNTDQRDTLLISFTRKNYMEPVWAILDKATREQIKEFMNSKHADCIKKILQSRRDFDSVNKFLSYKCLTSESDTRSPFLSDVNFITEREIKRRKVE